jgi:hypothetical protein
MFGGGSSSSQYSQSTTAAPASYTLAGNSAGTSGTLAPVSPGMIRKVQTRLQQDGDYTAQVDGIWGPRTESGVRSWQQAHSLTSNGEIDSATLQAMNISTGSQANNQVSQPTDTGSAAATSAQPAAIEPAAAQPTAAPPTANQNFNTGAGAATGSNYSSNNSQMPASSPTPANPGVAANATNDNGSVTGTTSPNATGGATTH